MPLVTAMITSLFTTPYALQDVQSQVGACLNRRPAVVVGLLWCVGCNRRYSQKPLCTLAKKMDHHHAEVANRQVNRVHIFQPAKLLLPVSCKRTAGVLFGVR